MHLMNWGLKPRGRKSIARLVALIMFFSILGLGNPGTAQAKTEWSLPAESFEVWWQKDKTTKILLATYTIDELEQMPGQVERLYSSIDSFPAPVFTAGKGFDLIDFVESHGIDSTKVKSFRFFCTDMNPADPRQVSVKQATVVLDSGRNYFPEIYNCWDEYWDPDEENQSNTSIGNYSDEEKVSEGAQPVRPMLAVKSFQSRAIASDPGKPVVTVPRPDLMNGLDSIRLCLGQNYPGECTTMNFLKWIWKVEIVGDRIEGAAPIVKADSINNTLGNDIELTFIDNENWNTVVNAVYVNNTALSDIEYKIDVSDSVGKIILDKGLFGNVGTYSIKITADGYNDVELTQYIVGETSVSLIPAATDNAVGKTLKITFAGNDADWYSAIKTVSVNRWDLPEDKYKLDPDGITIYPGVFSEDSCNETDYKVEYNVVVKATNYRDISVKQDIEKGTPPTLKPDTTNNILGQDIEIVTNNIDWISVVNAVSVNGTKLAAYKKLFSINIPEGKILIKSGAFEKAETYGIAFDAKGYEQAIVYQEIMSVEKAPNAASVATAKGNIEGAAYSMTQADATDEAVVKAAVEAVIAGLELDGVTASVVAGTYTPAVAGTEATPAGTDGTYTFTVSLAKGEDETLVEATTSELTMTIVATAYEAPTTKIAYTAESDITEITPGIVTFANGNFTVPVGITEFTFKDGDKEMKATFADEQWTMQPVLAEIVFTINGDAVTTATFTMAQLQAMTATERDYPKKEGTVKCTGVALKDLLTQLNVTGDSLIVQINTTDAATFPVATVTIADLLDTYKAYLLTYLIDGEPVTKDETTLRIYRAADTPRDATIKNVYGITISNSSGSGSGGTVVDYLATGDITAINPAIVTFADGEFTIPSEVLEFTFKDGDKEMKATFVDEKWIIAEVQVPVATLESIRVTTLPTKTIYIVDEELDLTGLVVTGTYDDKSTKMIEVTKDMISDFNSSKLGKQILTIIKDGKSTTFTVTITKKVEAKKDEIITITPADDPVTIIVPEKDSGAKIKVEQEEPLPLIAVEAKNAQGEVTVKMAIPEGTKIEKAPKDWDGTITLPEVKEKPSTDVTKAQQVNAVIEIGLPDEEITFDKAVRLLLPGQKGKSAGFIRNGQFTEITTVISKDDQATADRELVVKDGKDIRDGKVDSGDDLAIWTKHFTEFIAYTPTKPNGESPDGRNKGGGSTPPSGQTIGSKGGTIKEAGAEVNFFADAVSSDIKVTIKKLSTGIPSVPSGLNLLGEVYEISSNTNTKFNKSVTITLPFDPDEVDKDKHDVGIYCWSNNQWVVLDEVKVDLKAGKVSGEVNHFSKFAVLTSTKDTPIDKEKEPTKEVIAPVKPVIKDISGHWAETNISKLINAGAISGYPDGTFKPDSSITRAEFATVLVKALNLEPRSGKVFNDTTGHWAKDAISTAAAHGIVSGYDATIFGPDYLITREQMAVMISKAANLSGGEGKTFADNNQIADWAKAAVAAASGKNIISGYPDNTFRPQANATRAEAVTVVVKILN